MIVVKILMWRHGDPEQERSLGEIHIANTGEGTPDKGHYVAKLFKAGSRKAIWRMATAGGFPRRRLGPYDLLFRVLRNAVGTRNRQAVVSYTALTNDDNE